MDSIEWIATDSRVIVRGTIVGRDIARTPLDLLAHDVTFRVTETLKREPRESLRFVVLTNLHEEPEFRRTQNGGRPLLVFLRERRCVAAGYRRREPSRCSARSPRVLCTNSIVDLSPDSPSSVYDLSLAPLSRPEEVLRETREAIAARAGQWERAPRSIFLGEPFVRLAVPVDRRLEVRARG